MQAPDGRKYKFAWDEDIQIAEEDISDTDSSVCSSVHTSDLSNFEDSSDKSSSSEAEEEEKEDLENQLLLMQNEEGMGYIEGIIKFLKFQTQETVAMIILKFEHAGLPYSHEYF